MLVDPSQEEYLLPSLTVKTGEDISENLFVGMPDVGRPVRVVDRGGDEKAIHGMVCVPVCDPGVSGAIFAPQERIRAFVPADSASGIWWFLT